MLIKELQLSNFKVFADSARFPIKPITLLYGANSSGKSSILQALLMLKQSLKKGIESGSTLSAKGNMVDLGSFTQFIHNHDLDRSFSFKMTFPPPPYQDPESASLAHTIHCFEPFIEDASPEEIDKFLNERKEKVELPQIKKWAPMKRPISLKASERVLSKALKQDSNKDAVATDMTSYEDQIDVPAFLRKTYQKEIQKGL